jgi:hypothetical protein
MGARAGWPAQTVDEDIEQAQHAGLPVCREADNRAVRTFAGLRTGVGKPTSLPLASEALSPAAYGVHGWHTELPRRKGRYRAEDGDRGRQVLRVDRLEGSDGGFKRLARLMTILDGGPLAHAGRPTRAIPAPSTERLAGVVRGRRTNNDFYRRSCAAAP